MTLPVLFGRVAPVLFCACSVASYAQTPDPRDRSDAAKQAAATAARTTRGVARGPLPDPTLLDGSTQTADKKNEHGMLGEFEIPGDENVRSGKVGGPQNPPPPGGASGGQQMPGGMPQGGGGAQGQPPSGAQGAQGAAGGAQAANSSANAGGGAPIPGGGDPNAKTEGMQVGELQGNPAAQGPEQGQIGQKPQQMAIGDSAMQIQTAANATSAVGTQAPAGSTQQSSSKTGSGGKGGGGSSGGQNVERGRVMPSGL